MKNTKKQIDLIKEYETIESEKLDNYASISEYHNHNNEYKNISNGYGVELETGASSYETREKLAKFLNYKFKMNIETDSSIHCNNYGMELISQPYTREQWLNNKNLLKQFFDLLKNENIQTNHTTGLHIHISKKLIGKNDTIRENNINKLILILENYKETFIKFSKRDNFNYCAYMSQYNGDKVYKDLITIKNKKRYGHSTCINKDDKTYELRIFNGTTDFNTFMAYLQMTFNLVDIISNDNIDLTSLSFNDIVNYNKDFKELISYCKENKISNNSKIIDKTKITILLQIKENNKILKQNKKYNDYIAKVRTLLLNNMDLYNKDKENYYNNKEIYDNLSYIMTQTYINNNSIYYQFNDINRMLSYFTTRYITNIETGEKTQKRVFNNQYIQNGKNEYIDKLNKLENLIASKGGVI